jgi:hypothetical protein
MPPENTFLRIDLYLVIEVLNEIKKPIPIPKRTELITIGLKWYKQTEHIVRLMEIFKRGVFFMFILLVL